MVANSSFNSFVLKTCSAKQRATRNPFNMYSSEDSAIERGSAPNDDSKSSDVSIEARAPSIHSFNPAHAAVLALLLLSQLLGSPLPLNRPPAAEFMIASGLSDSGRILEPLSRTYHTLPAERLRRESITRLQCEQQLCGE
mmetsp:Transcript_4360/g.9687  ORF Transcript_4360/g.9687 Transcript_4360/m.9687 type:complete len:140 (+) Transcript_4360:928-1347(+)